MTHSPEPWTLCTITHSIEDNEGRVVVLGLKDVDMMCQSDEQSDRDDLLRIVACVNACRRIETDKLIPMADILTLG